MEKVKVGVIGLGARGSSMLFHLIRMNNYEIVSVCDKYQDRVDEAVFRVNEKYGHPVPGYTDWRELLDSKPEAILCITGWEDHFKISIEAMKRGIAVGCEVGGAYTLDDCYELVKVQHETGTPFMLLENCCYGRYEMLVMNMVGKGLFGEIVSCEGGYRHDLRTEVLFGEKNRHYRLNNYINRNCENYPTHDLGPIAQVLDINRTNYFKSLTSIASKSAGLNDYAVTHDDVDPRFRDLRFAQADIVRTVIECTGGQLVSLTLDTTLPRPYSRGFIVQGTRGMYSEESNYIYLDTDYSESDHFCWQKNWNNAEKYLEKYEHPVWQKYLKDGIQGGHGGMDGLVYGEFVNCLLEGRPMPITVEDAAAWMAVTPLSEISIREQRKVEFPRF